MNHVLLNVSFEALSLITEVSFLILQNTTMDHEDLALAMAVEEMESKRKQEFDDTSGCPCMF